MECVYVRVRKEVSEKICWDYNQAHGPHSYIPRKPRHLIPHLKHIQVQRRNTGEGIKRHLVECMKERTREIPNPWIFMEANFHPLLK